MPLNPFFSKIGCFKQCRSCTVFTNQTRPVQVLSIYVEFCVCLVIFKAILIAKYDALNVESCTHYFLKAYQQRGAGEISST